jgi:hypothetical protein
VTRNIRCPADHTHPADNQVYPTCGAEGGTIEIVLHDEAFVEDALQGEGADETGRQHLGFSVSAHEEQSWRSTPTGANVSSVRRKRASRSELEERTCQSAINLIARELEQVLEYRAPTPDEDQAGADRLCAPTTARVKGCAAAVRTATPGNKLEQGRRCRTRAPRSI